MKIISKEEKLLKILKVNANNWVDLWSLVMYTKSLHHNELIRLLRNKGYEIENKTQDIIKDGNHIKYSWYKLVTDEKPTLKQKILFAI